MRMTALLAVVTALTMIGFGFTSQNPALNGTAGLSVSELQRGINVADLPSAAISDMI
jgi:hypothetical protein